MRFHKKLKETILRTLVQALLLSPIVLILWNVAGPQMFSTAKPVSWHGAFSLCLLIKTLFAGDIVPLLYAETDKSKRSVKNKKPVRINTKTIDRRHAG